MLKNKTISQTKTTTIYETIHKGDSYQCKIDTSIFNELPDCYTWIADVGSNKYLQIDYNDKTTYLHRYILNFPTVTHHINHDTLDNRLCNIMACDYSTNNHYRGKRGKSKLPIGVNQQKSGRYVSRIRKDGITYELGTYDTPEQASSQYQKASHNLYNYNGD